MLTVQRNDILFSTKIEVFSSASSVNYHIKKDLKEGILYWRRFVVEDGLKLDNSDSLHYHIESHGIEVVEKSLMGVMIAGEGMDFTSGMRPAARKRSLIDETYTLPTGKTSGRRNGNQP